MSQIIVRLNKNKSQIWITNQILLDLTVQHMVRNPLSSNVHVWAFLHSEPLAFHSSTLQSRVKTRDFSRKESETNVLHWWAADGSRSQWPLVSWLQSLSHSPPSRIISSSDSQHITLDQCDILFSLERQMVAVKKPEDMRWDLRYIVNIHKSKKIAIDSVKFSVCSIAFI